MQIELFTQDEKRVEKKEKSVECFEQRLGH